MKSKSRFVIIAVSTFLATAPAGFAADKVKHTAAEYAAQLDKVMESKQMKGVHHTTAIPTNFPIPKYPNNVLHTSFVNPTSGPPTAMVTIITKDPPKTALDWYQQQCAPTWKIVTPPAQSLTDKEKQGLLYRMTASKDNQNVAISCSKQKRTGNTLVSIIWALQPKR